MKTATRSLTEQNHTPQAPSTHELRERIRQLMDDATGNGPEINPSQLKAVGYTRVSSTMQVLEGTSLEDQEARIVNYIHGERWQLLEMLTDPAASGRTSKRPGFTQLKKLVQQNRVHVVVVDRIDRIARHLPTFLEFVALLRKNNVKLISLREGIDYRKPWGKLVVYILGALAEFYSDNLSQELRAKRLMDAINGKLAPTYRFGFCKGDCTTCTDPNGPDYCPYYGKPDQGARQFRIHHPVEAHAVRLMASWYVTGRSSFADIANRLNTEVFTLPDGNEVRFRTKGRPGLVPPGPFDADAVRYILSNPIYAGFVTYAGSTQEGEKFRKPRELFTGDHKPMIDPLTFERIQHIRQGRFHRSDTQANPARPYPLSRLLVCSHRHGTMRALSVGKHRYYVDRICQIKHHERHQPNLVASPLEDTVRHVVGQLSLPEAWLRRVISYLLYDEGESAFLQDRLALHQRLEAETYLVRQGIISSAEFAQRRTAILNALSALEPTLNPVAKEALELLNNLTTVLAGLEPEEENLLYRSLFTAIVVNEQEIVAMEVYPPFATLHSRFSLPGTHAPSLGAHGTA